MPRTSEALVRAFIKVDDLLVSNLDVYIETASILVTDHCVPAGYDDAKLELIERWLAAHLYAVTDPRLTSESFGDASAKYQSKVDLHLNLSHYGQQAQLLAPELAELNEEVGKGKPKVTFMWLGTQKSCRVDQSPPSCS
jgi:hypothetical protein